MNPSEFREGIAKAIHDRINKRENRQIEWADELSWVQEQHEEEAIAVIACPEVQQLYVRRWTAYNEQGCRYIEYVALADWLKEARP